MDKHSDIMSAQAVSDLATATGKSLHTVRSWRHRESIPAEFWPQVVSMGLATFEELARSTPPRTLQREQDAA